MARNDVVRKIWNGTWSVLGSAATCGCVVLILPFFTAGLVVTNCRRCIKHHSRQGRRVYLKSESPHPLPLPPQRRFNLSNPNIPLAEQPKSQLLNLPYEIRQKIWQCAIGQHYTLDVRYKQGSDRLYCMLVPGFELMKRLDIGQGFHLHWDDLVEDLNKVAMLSMTMRPAFALIKACRQVYEECMPILYSQNAFRFTALDNVCFFNLSIRHQHAAKIRSLSLVLRLDNTSETDIAWRSTWFQIKTWMKGLKYLNVEIGLKGFPVYAERRLLMTALDLSGLESFRARFWSMGTSDVANINLGKFGRLFEKAVTRSKGTEVNPSLLAKLQRLSLAMDEEDDEDT